MGIRNAAVGLTLAALAALPAWAQPISQERIEFAPGETSATVEGAVSGSARVEYRFAGSAGQDVALELEPGTPRPSSISMPPAPSRARDERCSRVRARVCASPVR